MEHKLLITVLCLLTTLSRISCEGTNLDVNGNNKEYVQGVFLSVDALKDLQNRAQINNPEQPLTAFNEIRRPEQQIPSADQYLKTNPAQGIPQTYNPNGLNLIQTLNGGVPQQINPSLGQVNQDLIAVNQNGQFVSLKPVNVAQPNLVNNQIPNNLIGNNLGQPNLVLNNGQVPNQVYTVVPINNPSNQGLSNGNTYLVPLQQVPSNQILTLNNGK